MKTKYWIVVVLIALAIGFFIGSQAVGTKEIVKYIKGETVTGSVQPHLLTVKQEFDTDYRFMPYRFLRGDTVKVLEIEYIKTIPDTAKIVEDFLKKRYYEFTVFDDKNGKFIAKPIVQYNSLSSFDYSFTPIQKEITRYREKVLVPFAGLSYNTLNYIGVSGGLFYHNLGFEYQYQHNINTNNNAHLFGIKIKL